MDPNDDAAYQLVQDALIPPEERIKTLIASLPVIHKHSQGVDVEEPCPICLTPLSSIFEDEEKQTRQCTKGIDGDEGNEEQEFGLEGVTKLVGCGHIFCRRDLIEWIRSRHGSCPTCRHTFLDIRPPSESDDESSDGGEYIPNPEDFEDEDEDGFLDYDVFTDTDTEDFPVQTMDLDFDDMWEDEGTQNEEDVDEGAIADAEMGEEEEEEEDGSSEWGLTDGDSESMSSSECDLTMADLGADQGRNGSALEAEVNVSVHEEDDALNDAEKEEGLITHTSATVDPHVPK